MQSCSSASRSDLTVAARDAHLKLSYGFSDALETKELITSFTSSLSVPDSGQDFCSGDVRKPPAPPVSKASAQGAVSLKALSQGTPAVQRLSPVQGSSSMTLNLPVRIASGLRAPALAQPHKASLRSTPIPRTAASGGPLRRGPTASSKVATKARPPNFSSKAPGQSAETLVTCQYCQEHFAKQGISVHQKRWCRLNPGSARWASPTGFDSKKQMQLAPVGPRQPPLKSTPAVLRRGAPATPRTSAMAPAAPPSASVISSKRASAVPKGFSKSASLVPGGTAVSSHGAPAGCRPPKPT